MNLENQIRERIKEASTSLETYLKNKEASIPDHKRTLHWKIMIRHYTTTFEGNFLSWMAAAHLSARSPYAKFASAENLEVELRDNHPGMLKSFLTGCHLSMTDVAYNEMQLEIQVIRTAISDNLGTPYALALMALLENLSLVFIPFLRVAANELDADDEAYRYLDVHGEADIEHADQFVKALVSEAEFLGAWSSDEEILKNLDKATKDAVRLLEVIFSID